MKCGIYPALICGKDYKIKYKSKTFSRIAKTRKGASVLNLFCEFSDKIRTAGESHTFTVLKTERIDGICGVGIIPYEDEIMLVFIPSHFSEMLSESEDMLLTFLKILSEDEAEAEKASALAKIREKMYANFKNSFELFSPVVTDVSVVFRDCVSILSKCGSPFGIRLESKADTEPVKIGISAPKLAAELLCMYSMAYIASENKKLVFFANKNFGKLVFGFSADTSENPPAFCVCEKYMLSKLADINGEKTNITSGGGRFTVALQADIVINGGLSANNEIIEKLYKEFAKCIEY